MNVNKFLYILITFALASGLILFLPDDIINKMYMLDFRNEFRHFFLYFCYKLCISKQ